MTGDQTAKDQTAEDQTAEVLFCLPPMFGQQPFVFNRAVLRVKRVGEGIKNVKATVESVRFGKDMWKVGKECKVKPVETVETVETEKTKNNAPECDCVYFFQPHLGWSTTGTPLAFTYSVKWGGGQLQIMWLELGKND
ncbi:MAG: hypothetical protein M1839_004188 [Geoglossum umbratile]|nr:MAG: hypothetical protein M1839_004188 [Geoglossum umbratile]